jgi:thiamine pyrophosphate-dependent acetolactate synthase large subunit-like protein
MPMSHVESVQVYQTRDHSITEKFRKALESTSPVVISFFVDPEQPACPASMLALPSYWTRLSHRIVAYS